MRSLWQGLVRTIFWSYERGSWPYDVMVIAIVVFVLATPRSWFHDRPRSDGLASPGVQLVSHDLPAGTRKYRLDAKALPEEKRATSSTPELERETHDILSRTARDLKGRIFQVQGITPVRDDHGAVIYYDVTIHPESRM